MKKVIRKISFASLMMMTASPAFATQQVNANAICDLVKEMKGVFDILRNLAFVGAAFIIAGWAWGFISKGEVKMDDLKTKGTGLLVGFILLFGIGIFLTYITSAAGGKTMGCDLTGW